MEGSLVSWATWLLQVFDWAKLGAGLDTVLKIIIYLLLLFFVRALTSPRDLLDKTEQESVFFFFFPMWPLCLTDLH